MLTVMKINNLSNPSLFVIIMYLLKPYTVHVKALRITFYTLWVCIGDGDGMNYIEETY